MQMPPPSSLPNEPVYNHIWPLTANTTFKRKLSDRDDDDDDDDDESPAPKCQQVVTPSQPRPQSRQDAVHLPTLNHGMSSAKALSKAAISQVVNRYSIPYQGHIRDPPAAPLSDPNQPANFLLSPVLPPQHQDYRTSPVWNRGPVASPQDASMVPDSSPSPGMPIVWSPQVQPPEPWNVMQLFPPSTPLPPHEPASLDQQKHGYDVPSLATTFVGYSGSACDPASYGDNEIPAESKFIGYPPPASQVATVGKQPVPRFPRAQQLRRRPDMGSPQQSADGTPSRNNVINWAETVIKGMGYVPGKGLGVGGQGITYPVEAIQRPEPHLHYGLGVFPEMSAQQRQEEIRQTVLRGGDPEHLLLTQPMVPIDGISAAPAKKPPMQLAPTDEPVLCPEQAALVDLILQGKNVFYTGSAGCGKSTVLKSFVKKLQGLGKKVRIVAPTGRAALNVGGSTTWTFAGWTPHSHKLTLQKLKDNAQFQGTVRKRLKETDVLVIDEVSMIENLHFERLNEIMKAARHVPHARPLPFGGCQIVVTGDFCQLPPVKPFQHCIECGKELLQKISPEGGVIYQCRYHGSYADEDKWAFRSKAWEECEFMHIHLKMIHRQNDQTFIGMLQKCRLGELMEESEISLLMNHKCRVAQATKLFCTRNEADSVNRAAFNKLVGTTHTYWSHDRFYWRPEHPHLQSRGQRGQWRNPWSVPTPKDKKPLVALDEHRFSECVQLKKGMLVVLLVNLDLKAGLCNGSQGTVCGFEDYDPGMMPIRDTCDNIKFSGKITKEKATLKPGQRALRGEHAGIMELEIKHFVAGECAPIKKWPIVRFHNGIKCTVYAECSITQLGDDEPYSLLTRTQLPLAPAWAMTVHKSQSLTLDRVIVNVDRAFEEGQVYVALSRATGLEGLKIEGDGAILKRKLRVNPQVAAFLKEKFGDVYGTKKAGKAENAENTEKAEPVSQL